MVFIDTDILSIFFTIYGQYGNADMETTNFTPNYNQWNLSEGAKARLGTGYLTGNIVYSPDGTQLVVPCSVGIWIYDALTLEVIDLITEYRIYNSSEIEYKRQWWKPIEVHNSVGFSSDGRMFAIKVEWSDSKLQDQTSEQYTLQLWEKSGEQPESISLECPVKIDYMVSCPNGKILAGVYNPDGRTSYEGFKDAKIYLWEVDTGKLLNSLTIERSKIDSLTFSPDGTTIAITSSLPTGQFGYSETDEGIVEYEYIHEFIDVWDICSSRRKFGLPAAAFFGFSPDGCTLVGRIDSMTVALWNANTGDCNANYSQYDSSLGSATSLVFSPDGHTFAGRIDGDNVALWDAHNGICKHVFTNTGFIQSLIFSPDGQTLAGGCEDGTVLIWDVKTFKNAAVPVEKSSPSDIRTSQIQQLCKERVITTLSHFTRIENLQNILQEGLLGRSTLESREKIFLPNDEQRADRCPEANCLSISFPNYKMFWEKRKEKEQTEGVNINTQWVVLLLDARVLWELDCAFCQQNAAIGTVSKISLEERKKPEALKDLFEDFYDIKHQDLHIPRNYPTNPQAEVLVFERIPLEYINAIHFRDATILEQWRSNYNGPFSDKFFVERKYFDARSDYEVWKRKKFNNEGIPLSYLSEYNDEEHDAFILDHDIDVNKDTEDKNEFDDDIPF